MPPEPYPPFFLSREAGAVAPARPEPVLGWHPAPESGVRERWPAGPSARTRLGRFGGFSVWCHGLALAATLLWAERLVPPQPIDSNGAVAMVFAPRQSAAPQPVLPPAVETSSTAAPTPLATPPPPDAAAATDIAALATPEPPVAASDVPAPMAAPAPITERMQALPPEATPEVTPVKPPPAAAARPAPAHPTLAHPTVARTNNAAASQAPAPNPPAASAPTATTLAMAAPLVPPHPLRGVVGNRAPLYPISAERRREQGRVVLRVDVTVDGRADAVQVAVSSGFSALDRAAIEAVRQWRFVPATRGGTPVPGAAEVPINFTLSN